MGEISDALRRAKEDFEGSATWQVAERSQSRAAAAVESDGDLVVPISTERTGAWAARAVLVEPDGPAATAYRKLAERLHRELDVAQRRSVLVTSSLREEGRTTTACNLALALARLDAARSVALVDLDLRRPAVASSLGIAAFAGIEDVLAGELPPERVRIRTQVQGLEVYPARGGSDRVETLLASGGLRRIFEAIEKRVDWLIVDSPPVLLAPDAAAALAHLEFCIPVVRSGVTRRTAFARMLSLLPRERVRGVFLNAERRSASADSKADR